MSTRQPSSSIGRRATGPTWPNRSTRLGRVRSQLGDHTGADEAFEESIALKQQVKDLWGWVRR